MSPKIKDLTGQRFGKLVVIEQAGMSNGLVMWYCKCDCGGERTLAGRYLREGKANSCGCAMKDHQHGGCYTRLYGIWRGMKRRCNNPKCKDYHNYGGKGIKVCKEWCNSFAAFRDWSLSNGYEESLSIDRIDSNGNYQPDNCRWADNVTQSNNRCTNVFLEIDRERHTIAEWSRITGVDKYTIRDRHKAGKTGEDLIKQG